MNPLYHNLASSPVFFPREAGLARVSGPDRATWLQGMVSNDVAKLGAGSGCYAAHLNSKGRVLSLMIVLADEEDLWLVLDQDVGASVAALDKLLIMEDAEVTDCSGEFDIVTVAGSGAEGEIARLLGVTVALDSPYAHCRVGDVRVVRADLGYDVIAPADRLATLAATLAVGGVGEGDPDLWNLLTLEAGLPRYGIDVDETTTLPELGEKGIDYGKGCYIGQEVVAKIKYIGHVNRHFVGFKLTGPECPDRRDIVRRGEKEIGYVTRSAHSAALGTAIALGYVRLGSEAPGTEVLIGEASNSAVVTELPFVAGRV